jgi:carbon starvation protein CstA
MAFFHGPDSLAVALAEHGNNAAWAVNTISNTTLGIAGGLLAMLGVVAAPITSGDTAFRSARLIVADILHIEQRTIAKRLMISLPLFAIGGMLLFIDFDIIWRYFAWTNQAMATVTLWVVVVYLRQRARNIWVALPAAVFMTFICTTFVFVSDQFIGMENRSLAYIFSCATTALLTAIMWKKIQKTQKTLN